jgi:hypothetical protein
MFNFNINSDNNLDEIDCIRFKKKLIDSKYIVLTSDAGKFFMKKFAHFLKDHNVISPKLSSIADQHSVLDSDLSMFQILVDNGLTDKFNQHLQTKGFGLQIKSNKLEFYHNRNKGNLEIDELSSSERHFFYLYLLQFLDEEISIGKLDIFKQENYLFLELFDAPFDGSSTRKFVKIIENFKQIKCLIISFDINTSLMVDSERIFGCAFDKVSITLTKFDKSDYQKKYEHIFLQKIWG